MLTWINDAILTFADPLLDWLLWLPPDVVLLIVAVGTGAILTLARRVTTDQDLLRRCAQDKRRLRVLMRQARSEKDHEALQRYRLTRNQIGLMTLKAEALPLLAALVPIAVLGTWCFQRLAFVPPQENETVPVTVYFPISAAGGLVHMVPQEGLREVSQQDGAGAEHWIQEIVPVSDPKEGPPHALATWQLQARARPTPYLLEIRYRTGTWRKEMLVGHKYSSVPVESYADDQPIRCTEIGLKPVKLFGIVPGIDRLGLPPWLVAYLLLAVPSVSLLKRLTGIH